MTKLSVTNLSEDWHFPTTRYRGSKRKLLGWLWENLRDIEFESAFDLFSGSSVVSILFKRMGKRVTSNDFLKFNHMTAFAFIENSNTLMTDEDIELLIRENNSPGFDFIAKNFGDVYYLDNENIWLDSAIAGIHSLKNLYSGKTLFAKQSLAYWALGQVCLIKRPFNLFHRKNLYLRTNTVDRKFGNKTTWDKPFQVGYLHFLNEANQIVFDNGKRNVAVNFDAFQIKEGDYDCDLVYIDPPYFFPKQRDNDYREIYHFLEGIVQYTNWSSMIDRSTTNLRLKSNGFIWPKNDHGKLIEKYKTLLQPFSKKIITISHKAGSQVSVDELIEILIGLGKKVKLVSRDYKYALSKRNGQANHNVEWLIIGE